MQSSPQAQYKWIIVYQCHLTKFVILRALTSKGAAEVTFQLLNIFLLIGAPCILQSDSGSEFTAQVLREMKDLWPRLVHGKPSERHRVKVQSNRQTLDIKDMLAAWLSDNNAQDWSLGLRFVQNKKNSSYHSGIKRTPYAAMLGENTKDGLTSTSLLQEVIDRLEIEQ
ncbi:KRAB-A domain-containing protein 2-like [Palaemon carinicauda]|uniref:KRAB-A domain-containing protein 2-like n=1 Tax=Palaemon carinicauda TaxID=392227 RepID=UPI0035B6697F